MKRIKDINIEAWRFLCKITKNSWARHTFSYDFKCDYVTNNFTESFNAWIGDFRGKPILTLVESLQQKLMDKFHKWFQKACTWRSTLSPKYVKKLKEIFD